MLTNAGDAYMFRTTRYRTGETEDIIKEMKEGKIPCVDVDNPDELEWYLKYLNQFGIYKVEGLHYDRNCRDTIKEPEFECRIGFYTNMMKF
jgi:hypothetical protein